MLVVRRVLHAEVSIQRPNEGGYELTPDIETVWRGYVFRDWGFAVDEIAIDIMFKDELRRIEPAQQVSMISISRIVYLGAHVPVIENLTAQYVSADAPAILIPLLCEPVVTKDLGVKVEHLKR